ADCAAIRPRGGPLRRRVPPAPTASSALAGLIGRFPRGGDDAMVQRCEVGKNGPWFPICPPKLERAAREAGWRQAVARLGRAAGWMWLERRREPVCLRRGR